LLPLAAEWTGRAAYLVIERLPEVINLAVEQFKQTWWEELEVLHVGLLRGTWRLQKQQHGERAEQRGVLP